MTPLHQPALRAYLLGTVGLDTVTLFQRRLAYEVSEPPGSAAVVVCDHPAGVAIGRAGSRADVRRGGPVRWVARGGGTLLLAPGQVAFYPVLPLAAVGLTAGEYVATLTRLVADVCRGFDMPADIDADVPGVSVRGRRIAHVGVAVRHGVTTFGAVLNVCPDLEPFRDVKCDGAAAPMTSLQRECPHRVRVAAVRQRLLDALAARLGAARLTVSHSLPTPLPRPVRHADAVRDR